jgi:hypothetical protein
VSSVGTGAPWWPNLITWLLVLAGWFAVHQATLSRERRKERREAAKFTIESLRELEVDALKFHMAPGFDSVQADQLIYRAGRIIRGLQRTPMSELELPLGRMVRLRRSMTLNNADASVFKPQTAGSGLLMEIRAAVDDLVDAIETARDTKWA